MSNATRHVNDGLFKICPCPRRAWSKCRHAWHFSFQDKGRLYRISLDKHLGKRVDSKTTAEGEAEKIRTAIREGTFGQVAPRAEMTLRQLADVYLERYVAVERAARAGAFMGALATVCKTEVPRPTEGTAPLGDWRLVDIVTDTIERFREVRRGQGLGVIGTNRLLEHVRALDNWAVRTGYVESTPFKRHGEPVVKLSEEHNRTRRLDPDTNEGAALLAACGPHLRGVVEAALETGMRRGELLSLQWSQVEGLTVETTDPDTGETLASPTITWAPRAELVLPWLKTKTRRDRRIPISTRLQAILELRRFDPAGQVLPDHAYVFGNAIGQKVDSTRRAWNTAVLKAHGHAPTFTDTQNLSAESRAALEAIDLHFHDLRREAGSRWLEGGVPIHVVRDWLGHTSIAQTSTYLAGTMKTQHDAMAAFEAHRAIVKDRERKVRKGGRKSPQTAEGSHRKVNKTGVGREPAIM